MSWFERALRGMHGTLLRAFSRRPVSPSIARLPDPVPLAKVEDGARVRVRARVIAPDEPLRAPLTGRRCVLWSITIEERVEKRRRSSRWVSRTLDTSAQSFDVADGSGRASIDVHGMQAWARADATREEPTPVMLDPTLQILLARYGSGLAPLRQRGGKLRVREGVFEAGDEIFVQGRALWIDEGALETNGYRDATRTRRLVIGPDDDEPVYASNDEDGPY